VKFTLSRVPFGCVDSGPSPNGDENATALIHGEAPSTGDREADGLSPHSAGTGGAIGRDCYMIFDKAGPGREVGSRTSGFSGGCKAVQDGRGSAVENRFSTARAATATC
jgi:hypothetical protein